MGSFAAVLYGSDPRLIRATGRIGEFAGDSVRPAVRNGHAAREIVTFR